MLTLTILSAETVGDNLADRVRALRSWRGLSPACYSGNCTRPASWCGDGCGPRCVDHGGSDGTTAAESSRRREVA